MIANGVIIIIMETKLMLGFEMFVFILFYDKKIRTIDQQLLKNERSIKYSRKH